jgi:type I restriction enzyme M protein
MLKKDSYTYNQIVFALLALAQMFDKETLQNGLNQDSLDATRDHLSMSVAPKHKELLDFIFDDILSLEDDNSGLVETAASLNDMTDEEFIKFISSYRYHYDEYSGEVYTNGAIASIVASILGDGASQNRLESVLDIGCGQGVFLTEAAMRDVGSEYYGIDINNHSVMVAKLKMLILGEDPERIINENIFNKAFLADDSKKYDAVFCHMPMRMPMASEELMSSGLFDKYEAEKLAKHNTEWAFIKAMRKMTKIGGKIVALVAAGLLYGKQGQEFRKELVESGSLEGVLLLPKNLLNNTTVQTALLVLSKDNDVVKMQDASQYYEKGRRNNVITEVNMDLMLDIFLNGGMSLCGEDNYYGYAEQLSDELIVVSQKAISDNDYSLEPTKYILKEKVKFNHKATLENATTTIFRGVQIKADDQDAMTELYNSYPNCYLLNLSDISQGYIGENLEEVYVERLEKYERYMLKEGDVVICARGTKISTAVAEDVRDKRIIVTGNLIVIRCDNSLNPYYLKAYLDSNEGRSLLQSVQTGSAIFAINPKQLRDFPYEAYDMDKQIQIGEKVKWMLKELKDCYGRIDMLNQKFTHVYDDSKEV